MLYDDERVFKGPGNARGFGYSAYCPAKQIADLWQREPYQSMAEAKKALMADMPGISMRQALTIDAQGRHRRRNLGGANLPIDALMSSTPSEEKKKWWNAAEYIVANGQLSVQAILLRHEALDKAVAERLERFATRIICQSNKTAPIWSAGNFLAASVATRGWQTRENIDLIRKAAVDTQKTALARTLIIGALAWTDETMEETELRQWFEAPGRLENDGFAAWTLSALVHHPKAGITLWKKVAATRKLESKLMLACHRPSRENRIVRILLGQSEREVRAWMAISGDDDEFWKMYQLLAESVPMAAVELLKRRGEEGASLDAVTLSYIMNAPETVREPKLRMAAIALVGQQQKAKARQTGGQNGWGLVKPKI